MPQKQRIIWRIIAAVVGLILLSYLSLCLLSAKPGMNGFDVTNGMIRLALSGKEYVKVGEDRYLYKNGSLYKIVENEYDSYRLLKEWQPEHENLSELDEGGFLKSGIVLKEGKEYDPGGVNVWTDSYGSVYFKPYVEPTWTGSDAEINDLKSKIIKDVELYYTALYAGNNNLPEFTLPMKEVCKTFIEKRYNYDVQIPKSVGIAEITEVSVTVTGHTVVGYYLVFDVEMNLSFNYAEIDESGKVNRKMQIAVDMNDRTVADWHENYSRYEMDVRGVTDLTDPSCLLENSDIPYENAPVELEWTDDYLPLNIDPPSIKGRKFTYTNPDVSGRDLMGFLALIYYDNESGEYVNKTEGWGNDCVEKAEFTSEYIKIYFAENTILDELMYKIGGDIRINPYTQKRLTDSGQPTNYILSKKDFYYEASESYFTKENGRDILTLKFDEPITEPISSIDIEWGKID